ncbi:transposase [bacterium]|nr:transposase [bacterium]
MTRDRYKIYGKDKPHFVTSTIVGWLPVFSRPKAADIIFDSLRYLQNNDNLKIYAYVLMVNHIHIIASASDLNNTIARFKSYTARQIIDFLEETSQIGFLKQIKQHKLEHKTDREYQIWQEGIHPEMIFDVSDLRRKVKYIHLNPVRRGYVDDPVHWRYSSAGNYAGDDGILEVERDWV